MKQSSFIITIGHEDDEGDEVEELLQKLLGLLEHTPFQAISMKGVDNETEA